MTIPLDQPEASVQRQQGTAAPCLDAAVKRRARAGLVTIAVAVGVAVLTLAAAGAALLVTGIVPLSGLEGRIATAIAERLGPDWQVEADAAELGRIDGRSLLRVRQVAFRHRGGASLRAPEALLGYEPLALLRGEIRLISIDLRGVNIALGVTAEGALVLNADDAAPVPVAPAALPDAAQWDAFTGVMGAVTTLAQGEGLLGALETAGMHGARLTLIDPQGRQTAGLEDVDIELARTPAGRTRMAVKGRTGSRWKEAAVELATEPDGTLKAEIDIIRFEPAEALTLAGGGGVAIEALALSGKAVLTQKPDGARALTATLQVAPGTISVPGGPMAPLRIDSGQFTVESIGGLQRLRVTSGALKAGATELAGSGSATVEDGAWRVGLDLSGTIAGQDGDAPIAVQSLTADLRLDPRIGELRIDDVSVAGPGLAAQASGVIQQTGPSPTQRLSIRATQSDARAILALWPRWTSHELHDVLSRQLISGRIDRAEVTLDLAAEDHARMVQGGSMPDAALSVTISGSQVRFQPGPGLPQLVDAVVAGKATGRTVQLAISQARADLGGGRQLALSEGSFVVPELWMPRAPARIAFRTMGGMDGLAALFGFPALKEFAPSPVDPAAIRGTIDLRTTMTLPLVDDPKPGEIVVQTAGSLAGVASEMLLAPDKLEAGQFTVAYDRAGLTVRGEARIGGDRGQVEIRQNSRGIGEAAVTLLLDGAARQRRGLGPELGVTGSVQAKVVKPLGPSSGPPRIEFDLARAAIDSPMPGLSKAAGRPGRAAFTYLAGPDGTELDDLALDMGSVQLRGRIALNRQNQVESAALTQLRLSPGDNLTLQMRRDGAVHKLTVRGAVADVRPFIRNLQSPSAGGPRADKAAAKGPDVDLDLAVPILTGFNNEAITNATLKLAKRAGEVRNLAFQGMIGRAGVKLEQQAAGPLDLTVERGGGGSLLRFVDLYRRAYGGDLELVLTPGERRQSGILVFRDFVVRDEPALRRVVGEGAGAAPAGDRADAAPAARLDVGQVAFTKLRAQFTRSASRLDIAEMVIWGQQVGFTLEGNVDYGRDRVDIGGTFVPGYAFNNAFAQVPIVGPLLGGGSQYGGLFAVNFKIAGTASAPTMTINPLSAIAPGILRRFVDPLGGAPDNQPLQPAPQRR